jgi:hypothetical protein
MMATELDMFTDARLVQLKNAPSPMVMFVLFIDSGLIMVTEARLTQPLKAKLPTLVTEAGMSMDVMLVHPWNAPASMMVTPLGTVTRPALLGVYRHPGTGGRVGDAVGDAKGNAVGNAVGNAIGDAVGNVVGTAAGAADGKAVGVVVGAAVGLAVGAAVKTSVGETVGADVGSAVGVAVVVGMAVGAAVGDAVGDAVGNIVGDTVGEMVRVAKLGEALGVPVGEAFGIAVGCAVGADVLPRIFPDTHGPYSLPSDTHAVLPAPDDFSQHPPGSLNVQYLHAVTAVHDAQHWAGDVTEVV